MRAGKLIVGALVGSFVLGVVALGCGGGGIGGREITLDRPVTIQRSFEEGDVLKYKLKLQTQSGVKRTAYEQSVSSQIELRTTNTFTRVTPDEVDMVMRFDYAVGSFAMADQLQRDENVSSLAGKELTFTLSPKGRVLSWSGLSEEAALEQGAGQLAMLLYDLFPPLPDEPVTIGTTWTEDYDVPDITSSVDRDFVGDVTYTVVGFKEKYGIECAEIHSVANFEFEGRAEQAGEVWLMSGEGTSTGTMLVSLADGNIVYGTSDASMTLTGEGASVASAAATGVVEMGIKSKLVIELL